MELLLEKYEAAGDPQNDMVGYVRSVCNEFSYKFSSGVYFLTGEIDSGAWSFVYSLLDECPTYGVKTYKDIILNGKSVELEEIKKLSFHVGQYKMYGKKRVVSVLKQALKKSKSSYTIDDLFDKIDKIFIEDEMPIFRENKNSLLEHRMHYGNLRTWWWSPLIGLALNKKIFVFPWLSQKEFHSHIFLKIFRMLSREDVIVLVPCSEKIIIPNEDKFNIVRMSSLFQFDFENMER